jgi:hypothetical protein
MNYQPKNKVATMMAATIEAKSAARPQGRA